MTELEQYCADLGDDLEIAENDVAEVLSEQSYCEALSDYFGKAKGLFEVGENECGYHGLALAEKILMQARRLENGDLPWKPISDWDFEGIVEALQLPSKLHYCEFDYVGKGGDFDNGKFKRIEKWVTDDETDVRKAVVESIAFYCLQAATLAKRHQSERAQRLFARAYVSIQSHCRLETTLGASCPERLARQIPRWIAEAQTLLWADLQIEQNEKAWEASARNLQRMTETPPSGSEDDDEKTITLGVYASKFIKSIDNETRTIVFYGTEDRCEEELTIPPTSHKAWQILKLVAESTDEENGGAQIPEKLCPWYGHFYRSKASKNARVQKQYQDLRALRAHLASCKDGHDRGLPAIHLVPVQD